MQKPLDGANATAPLISICVLCYNQERFLTDLFNSILEQTYKNIELIFIDDCSTDESFSFAKSFEERLSRNISRVIIRKNDVNRGGFLTAELAFSLATGDFMSSLDADDFYLPNRVAACAEFLVANPDYDAVHSDYFSVVDGKISDVAYWKSQTALKPAAGWAYDDLIQANTIGHLTMMMRAECFRRSYQCRLYQERGYQMGDYPSMLAMSKITPIGYIDEPLACYRILANSTSHAVGKKVAFKASAHRRSQDFRLGLL
jgi:glycosyltransferase involved in cell wall biosynthesis